MNQVSFQTRDADGNVHGDPDAINVHISTGALIMTVLGYGSPAAACDVVAAAVDPQDVLGRCLVFLGLAHLMPSTPAVDVPRLARRIGQIRALAEQAIVDGHRITWA